MGKAAEPSLPHCFQNVGGVAVLSPGIPHAPNALQSGSIFYNFNPIQESSGIIEQSRTEYFWMLHVFYQSIFEYF
jgi:hypothetical protein